MKFIKEISTQEKLPKGASSSDRKDKLETLPQGFSINNESKDIHERRQEMGPETDLRVEDNDPKPFAAEARKKRQKRHVTNQA